MGKHIVTPAPAQKVTVTLVDPGDIPALKPSKTQVGGGGGGGDRDVLQASKGKLPKLSMQQITPPIVVVRNPNPKLAVEPAVLMPQQIKLPDNPNMPNIGVTQSPQIALASTDNGVLAGTNPSAGNASELSNGPYGAVRWITILPVLSLAWIPEIVLALPVEYAVAPTTIGVMNAPAPPHGMCTARSKARSRSRSGSS